MLRKKGAIPSGNVENSDEFTHTTAQRDSGASLLACGVDPAPEGSGQSDKETVTRISPCVDIEYPFTEEGKPSCLSRACPKDKECKVCCKDWRKS